MSAEVLTPVAAIYDELRALNAAWSVHVGRPGAEPGWVTGDDLRDAARGPFHQLLCAIGERAGTRDRRTIAASFALRYGWGSAMAIAPFLRYRCVPDVSLGNIALKFKPSTFFERTAIYDPRGTMIAADPRAGHASIATVADEAALVRVLRRTLYEQALPVVDALYRWSGFARRGTWGMVTSSWAAQFTGLCENRADHRVVWPVLDAFFAGDDLMAEMQPRLHAVAYRDHVHLYQRRASCCRYYLLPQGDLCASCPLVPHDERLARNQEWMAEQIDRTAPGAGHS